nr:hypothetical protein [Tanacetum cinerariifolium]
MLVLKIPTERNVANLLTKSLDVTRFGYLVVNIGFCWLYIIPADFTDAAIPVAGLDSTGCVVSAGDADSASGLTSTGILLAAGPTISAEPSSPIRDPTKGKAVATPSSHVRAPTDKELADQQAAILEAER